MVSQKLPSCWTLTSLYGWFVEWRRGMGRSCDKIDVDLIVGGDSPLRTLRDEGFEPSLVSLQVGFIHFNRTCVIGQHVEEHLPEESHGMAVAGGAHQVDPLE